MNPFAQVRKVPLFYGGVQSNAYSVQTYDLNKKKDAHEWKEVGNVTDNYLLVNNSEVKDMADDIMNDTGFEWEPLKRFWDGKRFMDSYICKSETEAVKVGDDVGLGISFWNSYDGSTALSFRLFMVRLLCTNGMLSKHFFHTYRFKHDKKSANYYDEITNVSDIIANSGDSVKAMARKLTRLDETGFGVATMSKLRQEKLNDIPVTLWGKIVDRYLENYVGGSCWDFLNAGTDIIWHDKKPTMATFNHNTYFVDGMMSYVS
tara:strand:- start:1646 stop:2428 length:783 start_codon:yes stop_codon:yes gene_type:complete